MQVLTKANSIGSLNYEYVRYTLVKDLQGNVIGLADKNGNLAAKYTYDAWGNILSVTDGQGNDVSGNPGHIANVNPLRYRGYYFDQETGFYYLHTRYYDPKVGRFINADELLNMNLGLLGANMFAYCCNNPVMYVDPNGTYHYDINDIIQNLNDTANAIIAAANKGLPKTGKPNSKDSLKNEDGTTKQERWYGPDGNATRDRDYNHSGNMPFPHDHEWKDGIRQPDHLPPDPTYKINWEPVLGVVLIVGCVAAIALVAADNVTGIGVLDDFLYGPLGAGVGQGLIMIFG